MSPWLRNVKSRLLSLDRGLRLKQWRQVSNGQKVWIDRNGTKMLMLAPIVFEMKSTLNLMHFEFVQLPSLASMYPLVPNTIVLYGGLVPR